MKDLYNLFKDAWTYAKTLTIVAFIKDAIIGGKEVFGEIREWLEVIIQWALYIVPIWCTWHFIGPWYIMITIAYLGFGTLVALFNDDGPMWASYLMLYFWLPYAIIVGLFVNPVCKFLRKIGVMKPKYTPGQIKVSKHLEEVGREVLENNNNNK